MKYIVYVTTNNINSKIYIGVHKTVDHTLFDGYIGCGIKSANQALLDYVFHRAVKKYGYESFTRHTLAIFDNANDAYFLERQVVTEAFVQAKTNYNSVVGGVCNASTINKTPIIQYSLSGKLIKEWLSITDAADYFGCSAGTLRQALVPPFKSRSGFQWRCNSVEAPTYIGYYGTSKRVAQYSLDGDLLKVWSSCSVAATTFGKQSDAALNKYAKLHKVYEGSQWRILRNGEDVPEYIEKYIAKDLIIQLDLEGEFIKEWNKQVLYKTTTFKNVKDCINGRTKSYKGFKWMYKRDYTINS